MFLLIGWSSDFVCKLMGIRVSQASKIMTFSPSLINQRPLFQKVPYPTRGLFTRAPPPQPPPPALPSLPLPSSLPSISPRYSPSRPQR